MKTIITVPSDTLRGLHVQQGDLLRILSADGDQFRIELQRPERETSPPQPGNTHDASKVQQWIEAARGRVRLAQDETVQSVLDEYYQQKYRIER